MSTVKNGFSLLELLIVIAILAVISTIGFGFYMNFVRSSELDFSTKDIAFNLKQAQAKSMAGEDGRKWGTHFVNGADDYYEIFSTPTDYSDAAKTINSIVYLQNGIFFTIPVASSTVIFDKIRGTVSSNFSLTISSPANQTKTVNVSTAGNIY